MERYLITAVFLLSAISLTSVGVSYVPPDTNAESLWVSENASDFWVMNNPEGRIKNDPAVFHYNSSYKLIEKIHLQETSKDFLRINSDRWLGVDRNKIKIYDNSWDIIRKKQLDFEYRYSRLEKVRKNRGMVEALAWINNSFYSYRINLENLKLEDEASENLVNPNEYSTKDDWVRYDGYLFKNETIEKEYDNETNEQIVPLFSDDGQVENGSIWILADKMANGSRIGAEIYQYSTEMNEISSFEVGLNESQVDQSFNTNFIGILFITLFMIFLGFVLTFIVFIILIIRRD